MGHPPGIRRRQHLLVSLLVGALTVGVSAALFLPGGAIGLKPFSWFKRHPWKHKRVVPVDILAKLNNDGIAWASNPEDGNFDHPDLPEYVPGSTFPGDEMPAAGSIVHVGDGSDWKFIFPSTKDGALNNVACAGQFIEIPFGAHAEVALLAASDGPAQIESLRLFYHGRAEEAPIRVPGWLEKEGGGSPVAHTTSSHLSFDPETSGVKRQQESARLWVCTASLDPSRNLHGFVLPYNEKLHVFAVSLRPAETEEHWRELSDGVLRTYRRLGAVRPTDRRGLAKRLRRLQESLWGQGAELRERWPRELDWVETSVSYLDYRLGAFLDRGHFLDEEDFLKSVREVRHDLDALRKGRNPFADRRGVLLRSYRSEIDGSLQPYSLGVPEDYDAKERYPLVILLHGHGWYEPFQGHPTFSGSGVFYAAPHGRGSMDYMHVAEQDLLDVIGEITRDYSIDPDGIALTGTSMGGTGSWNYGVKFPHLFSAIAPKAGNSGRRVWEQLWGWGNEFPPGPIESFPGDFRALCTFVADNLDPVTYARNLLNLPAFCIHGAQDDVVPVEHARAMVELLRKNGCDVTYREPQDAGHGGFAQELYDEQWNWLFRQTRREAPEKLSYRTWKLKYGRCYWLTIRQFREPMSFADVEAEVEGSTLTIRTQNVQELSIDWERSPLADAPPPNVTLRIDEVEVKHEGGSHFGLGDAGKWAPAEPTSERCKRPHLEGPVEDVYTTPFLLVYGTPEGDPDTARVLEAEATRFVRDWESMYHAPCRIKSDADVTDEDLSSLSLVLYGNADENVIHRRIAAELPIQVDRKGVRAGGSSWEGDDLGVKFCYPNPLNRERYVCVFAGTTWQASYGINNRFGNWFRWGPFDNRSWFDYVVFDGRTLSPATVVKVGFFNQKWQLSEPHSLDGDDELRRRAVPRAVPALFAAPGGGRVYLSDLFPTRVDQHKGNVRSDRSYLGNPLRLGGVSHRKGLGVRAPSTVEYAIGGKFGRFHALVGIDLEGGEGSEIRLKNEFIQFLVWGDKRRLYRSPWLQWNSGPVSVDVPIKGVRSLRLEVTGSSARWHFGSAAWADAYVGN